MTTVDATTRFNLSPPLSLAAGATVSLRLSLTLRAAPAATLIGHVDRPAPPVIVAIGAALLLGLSTLLVPVRLRGIWGICLVSMVALASGCGGAGSNSAGSSGSVDSVTRPNASAPATAVPAPSSAATPVASTGGSPTPSPSASINPTPSPGGSPSPSPSPTPTVLSASTQRVEADGVALQGLSARSASGGCRWGWGLCSSCRNPKRA